MRAGRTEAALRIGALLAALVVAGCASPADVRCPDLGGSYRDAAAPDRLSEVFGLTPAAIVSISSVPDGLQVKAGTSRRTLMAGKDYRCEAGGLRLQAPVTSGFDVPGLAAQHLDRYYTLRRDPGGALVGTSTDRTRVRFLLPELESAGKPGPTVRWQPVNSRSTSQVP